MINLERMDNVIVSLEELANTMKEIAIINETLNKSVEHNANIVNTLSKYDKKAEQLDSKIEELVNNLIAMNDTYKLEKEAYDNTQIKLTEFSNSVDSLNTNVNETLNEYISNLKGYDQKTSEMHTQIEELVNNLIAMNDTYKLEKEAYDNTQIKLTEFSNSVDSLNTNINETLNEYISNLKGYDQKTSEMHTQIETLINKLEEIRNDYHKVSSSFEIVDTDLKQFSSKLDLISMDVTKLVGELKENVSSNIISAKQELLESVSSNIDNTRAEITNKISALEENIESKNNVLLKENKNLKISIIVLTIVVALLGIAGIIF